MSSTSNEFKSVKNEGISLRTFVAAIAFFVLTCTAPAEEKSASKPLHTLRAIQASGKITLDGVLDEETWTRAVPATDFIQRDPDEGKKATERTDLRVAFDGSAIYFGVRLFDGDPNKIVSRLSRRTSMPTPTCSRSSSARIMTA